MRPAATRRAAGAGARPPLTLLPMLLLAAGGALCAEPPFRYTVAQSDRLGATCGPKYMATAGGRPPDSADSGVKMIYGKQAAPREWPFAVALSLFKYKAGVARDTSHADGAGYEMADIELAHGGKAVHCTGTLISERHVLTAAHCIRVTWNECARSDIRNMSSVDGIVAVFGQVAGWRQAYDATHNGGIKVVRMLSPKGFKGACGDGNDIAILELARPVPAALFAAGWASLACLPSAADAKRAAAIGYYLTYGYGVNSANVDRYGNERPHTVLNQGSMFALDRARCEKSWLASARHHNVSAAFPHDYVCTKEQSGAVGCQGDSGGPLMMQTFRRGGRRGEFYVAMAVLSTGTSCELIGQGRGLLDQFGADDPDLHKVFQGGKYTDVSKHLRWICGQTGICYGYALPKA